MKYGIIGSGPAGTSLAIYLARANKDVTIFDSGKSSLLKTDFIDNYYGKFNQSGPSIYNDGRVQAIALNAKIIDEEVIEIEQNDKFTIKTGNTVENFDVVVLASGSILPNVQIKNLNKFVSKGVSYCAVCDGFFYRNRKIGLFGKGDYLKHELEFLENITNDITIFTNGEELSFSTKHTVITKKVNCVEGDDIIQSLITDDNERYELDGLFIADSSTTNTLALKLGLLLDSNSIKVDENYQTNIKNVYAIGDAIKGPKQIAKAVYQGMDLALKLISKKD